MTKLYIGDSVYASYDGYQFCLTTENGMGPSNEIFLEPSVMQNLFAYVERAYGVTIKVEKKAEGA